VYIIVWCLRDLYSCGSLWSYCSLTSTYLGVDSRMHSIQYYVIRIFCEPRNVCYFDFLIMRGFISESTGKLKPTLKKINIRLLMTRSFVVRFEGVKHHFQQNISYIVAVTFIAEVYSENNKHFVTIII
jgi:hypothetical protein